RRPTRRPCVRWTPSWRGSCRCRAGPPGRYWRARRRTPRSRGRCCTRTPPTAWATWSPPGPGREPLAPVSRGGGRRGTADVAERRTSRNGGRPGAVVLPAVRRITPQEAGGGPAGGVLPPPAPEPGSSLCASRSTASLALPVPVWILSLYLPLVLWSTVFAALSRPLWILSPCCWARSETFPFAGPSLAFRLSRRPMVHLPSRPVLCAGALTGV